MFERLRQQSPVHLTEESQFGSYWSITRFEDVKYVDTNQQLFSSDIMNGGIRLGGRPLAEPPPDYSICPCLSWDQPVHDAQRKTVAPMFTATRLAAMEELIRQRAGAILDGLPRGEDFNWVQRYRLN